MLSHVNDDNRPSMVDVGAKQATRRTASARAIVHIPAEVAALLEGDELRAPKGPVFQTAILAGIMAAKRTGDLIPLCHPLGLEDCRIQIALQGDEICIDCQASLVGKTGVEMEALTGATIAALTVYDMCKGVSPKITVREVRLIEKTGGKKDYRADD